MASWRRCSSCRNEIGFEQIYWECSVSTCARVAKTGLFFCSVSCWEAHLPTMRHREAWAVEKRAPNEATWLDEERAAEGGAGATSTRPAAPLRSAEPPSRSEAAPSRLVVAADLDDGAGGDDILIVVSKLKKYIRARSGMNTSDGVMSVLSDHLRKICDRAIRHAADDGRKTVLDRDFKAIL